MPSGTGLDMFGERFPERTFDVGIAEQHAVTFAAGLAAEGMKPFAAIYSTFLQRGYDQVVHDVAIQRLPVRFAIDRAGLVGADGATHAGCFDVGYLGVPARLRGDGGVRRGRAGAHGGDRRADRRPAVRLPLSARRGRGRRPAGAWPPLEIGKGRIVREGTAIAILCFGTRLAECLKAADDLAAEGSRTTVADARFAKPLDTDLILRLAREHEVLITVEEGADRRLRRLVLQALADGGLLDRGLKVRTLTLPDCFRIRTRPSANTPRPASTRRRSWPRRWRRSAARPSGRAAGPRFLVLRLRDDAQVRLGCLPAAGILLPWLPRRRPTGR